MRAEPFFKAAGDMRVKRIGEEEMGGRVIGALKWLIHCRDFFKCACQAFGIAGEQCA